MKFSYALTAIFSATAVIAAPAAQVQGLPASPVPVDAGLLAKLSPDVAALVTGLGLTSLAPGLAGTLISLSEGLKARQVPSVPGAVPVDAGLLAKLSPDVAALVTGLGLTSLAPGLAGTLISLSEGLKARADSPVPNIPVDGALLAKLSPDVAALVSGLGLTTLSPGLAATLVTLSQGLKTRDVPGAPNVPVDAGLLAKLSPDVAALVTGLGLTSLAPGLAGTLISLSEGLAKTFVVIVPLKLFNESFRWQQRDGTGGVMMAVMGDDTFTKRHVKRSSWL
ncbi:hypothetical protein V498_02928 [Pseudogymnoascus sp. VKM F-4517 (FW-2822)]|nr:hypothetical protein V498_02928 [Pseudogymnoascus sp. VKM F-4517 (FW-2822)]